MFRFINSTTLGGPFLAPLFLLPFLALSPARAASPSAVASRCPEILSQPWPAKRGLPPELEWANDVRWAGTDAVYITSITAGVFRLELGEEPRLRTLGHSDFEAFWLPNALGVSQEFLVAASPVQSLAWTRRQEEGQVRQIPFTAVVDLDLVADRLVVLGARRDVNKRFAPAGAIVWTGSLRQDLEDMKSVFYSTSGSGAPSLNDCGMMGIGAVRMHDDGSFVVAPGFESGVFHVRADGTVLRTWLGDSLGFDAGCGLTKEEVDRLSLDEPARWAWVNQRRTIDDILLLPEGPALVVRRVDGSETRWQLKILKPRGVVETCDVPFVAASPLAHLRGDLHNGKLVLLVAMKGRTKTQPAPALRPQLLVLDLRPPAGTALGR